EIVPRSRREARVESIGRLLGGKHRDRLAGHREMCVERAHHALGLPVPRQVEMGDLSGRMDARIGAARTADRHLLPAKGADRLLDRRLHGMLPGLPLPAGIGRSVILDEDSVARHRSEFRKRGGIAQFACFGCLAPSECLQIFALIPALESCGALMRVSEAAVIGRFAEHDRQLLARLTEHAMRVFDQRAADSRALVGKRDRQWRERHGRELTFILDDPQAREEYRADQFAFVGGDEFEYLVALPAQRFDEVCFARGFERESEDLPDFGSIPAFRLSDDEPPHHCSFSGSSFSPRVNSEAPSGLPPAGCSSTSWIAPLPQAIVSASSRTWPGAPLPSPILERSSLTRSALPATGISHQAPGEGDSPRMWLCTCAARLLQSTRVSSLEILLA